jgi:hypothetical protein
VVVEEGLLGVELWLGFVEEVYVVWEVRWK